MRVPKVPKSFSWRRMVAVRIVGVPSGDAPIWVRQAWVGLVLPTRLEDVHTFEVKGVLSTSIRSRVERWVRWAMGRNQHIVGYVVDGAKAIEVLSEHAPEAARWWRENAPRSVMQDATLIFDEDACEPVPSSQPSPAND